jgi:alkyl hydroperoxide reductase subunit F
MYDLAIIGGGPAGVAAGVYAARKHLKTVLITEAFGGQSTDSAGIENWIGTIKISGLDLAKNFEAHLRAYAGEFVDIKNGTRVQNLEKKNDGFVIKTGSGEFEARAILVASGGKRKRLEAKGASEFENKGLIYCASCDGPLFTGQDTVVVGGGNAGFETCAQLLAYAKSVTLIHRSDDFHKADATTVKAVLAHPNMRVIKNSRPVEIKGSGFVSSVVVENTKTGEKTEIPTAGVFVEIGMLPSTDFIKGLLELDEWERIKVNAKNQHTSVEGIWAAGDCTDELYHQNNIAAGDAVKALEDIYFWIKAHTR